MTAEERITQLEKIIQGLLDTTNKDAVKAQRKFVLQKYIIVCLCIAFFIGSICAAVVGIYAINRNYEYLESLIIETESFEYEIEADSDGYGNANAIYGDDNIVAGGDMDGQSKN